MLEPGTRMLKWICILIFSGLLLYVFHFRIAAFVVWIAAGINFAVLLILLAIEAYQDNVLNDIAIKENNEITDALPGKDTFNILFICIVLVQKGLSADEYR